MSKSCNSQRSEISTLGLFSKIMFCYDVVPRGLKPDLIFIILLVENKEVKRQAKITVGGIIS